MIDVSSSTPFFITGGTLSTNASSYVVRQADTDLFGHLLDGEFCYVLNSRQMGKSSLMVRTAARLKAEGVMVAVLDLTAIGQNLSPEQWYSGLLSRLGIQLNLEDQLEAFYANRSHISPLQRWQQALTSVVLPHIASPLVLFVDEIDAVRSLPFSADEFFAAIRQGYVGRATDPELKRLTFCLLGTATPAALIQDTRVSPFNVGRRVEVRDFTEVEAGALSNGLGTGGRMLLERVLYWTGGHPYLTQRLCLSVAAAAAKSASDVDRVCRELFLTHRAKETDDNLTFVRNRLLRSEVDLAALLDLYRRMREGRRIPYDETNPLCPVIRLSGVARVRDGLLQVRNRIYSDVFDKEWVANHMPDAESRRQQAAYRKGVVRTLTVSAVVFSIIGSLAVFGFLSARRARVEAQRARIAEGKATAISEENLRNLYFAKMNVIPADYQRRNFTRIDRLLDETRTSRYRGFEWGYWNRMAHQEIATLVGHSSAVVKAVYSPDGRQVVTVGDTRAMVWDARNAQLRRILTGHTGKLIDADWSPDGKWVVATGKDGTATVWGAATGEKRLILRTHAKFLSACAYTPDGSHIVTGGYDDVARIWDASTGKIVRILAAREQNTLSIRFSPVGSRFLTANLDGTACEWDWKTGKQLFRLKASDGWLGAASYSPNGKSFVTVGRDDYIRVWDVATKHMLFKLSSPGGGDEASFSRDGARIIAAGFRNDAAVWDVKTRKIVTELRGHGGAVLSVQFAPDGKTAITASEDGSAKLWDVRSARDPHVLARRPYFNSAQFSADGNRLLLGATDTEAVEFERPFTEVRRVFRDPAIPSSQKADVRIKRFQAAYSGRASELVFVGSDGFVRIGDARSGKTLSTSPDAELRLLTTAGLASNGVVVAGGADDLVQVWDAETGVVVRLAGRAGDTSAAAVSAHGRWVATASGASPGKTVLIWDRKTGRLCSQIGQSDWVYALAFTIDGNRLLAGCKDGTVRLWDVQTARLMRTYGPTSSGVTSLGVTPDGRRIVCGTERGDLVFWDYDTGQEALWIYEHTNTVNSLSISPDGNQIVTASGDGTARIFVSDRSAGGASR